MMSTVTIIDYGIGNLRSVCRAFEHLGVKVTQTDSPQAIEESERLVLPGVGAFADGMEGLRSAGLIEPIQRYAATGRPFLGICLGMQMMMEMGEEFGEHKGLGLIAGRVVRIPSVTVGGNSLRVPQVGWNCLHIPEGHGPNWWSGTILDGINVKDAVYFVHSFAPIPVDKECRLADCIYGGHAIVAVIRKKNLYGCQFHPEKSGQVGLKILERFLSHGSHGACSWVQRSTGMETY